MEANDGTIGILGTLLMLDAFTLRVEIPGLG